jgi:hypothetical protein
MALTINTGDLKGKKADQLDSMGVNPGRGMMLIKSFGEYTGKSSEHIVEMEVVAWSVTAQDGSQPDVGKPFTHRIFTDTSKGEWQAAQLTAQLAQLAMAVGLITPDQLDAMIKGGASPELDLATRCSEGIPVFIELTAESNSKDETKKYINVAKRGTAIYHVGDPRCKGWPTNQGVLNRFAPKVGAYKPLGSTVSGGATKAPASDPLGGIS